jgi:CDP-4-dehydro-6-deoxyglucose reductase
VRLETAAGVSGEYSLASCPCDATKLEFHIRQDQDAGIGPALAALHPAEAVRVSGPYGQFVLDHDASRPLLMIAVDAGFAPIKGLIEQAIALDLVESIDLFWVDTDGRGHYLGNLCRSWADALDLFDYHPLTAQGTAEEVAARLLAALEDSALDLTAVEVYAAADAGLLPVLRHALLGAGVQPGQLHLEPLRQGGAVPPAAGE